MSTLSSEQKQYRKKVIAAARTISDEFKFETQRFPKLVIWLGSAQAGFAKKIENPRTLQYSKVPGFPVSKIPGHDGDVTVDSRNMIMTLGGRSHLYEGTSPRDAVFPIHVMFELGIKTFILTNTSGAINKMLLPGDIGVIEDHINPSYATPLYGENDDYFGPRFVSMTTAYSPELQKIALRCMLNLGIRPTKGVYIMHAGPQYETPAEIRMYRNMGADFAGMSTVYEAIEIAHGGGECLGITLVTNMGAGITGDELSHEEVTEAGKANAQKMDKLLLALVTNILGR